MKHKKRRRAALSALLLWGLLTLALALPLPLPLQAGDVLMTQGGFAYWLQQKMLPRNQQVDSLQARAAALAQEIQVLEDTLLARIYLWPGSPAVEYRTPGGALVETVSLDVPPQVRDGRTLVPLRFVGEALGAAVQWQEETRQIIYLTENRQVVLTVGQKEVLVNGQSQAMDVAPTIVNGRTLVPVRFISQWLGASVKWEAAANRVVIRYYAGTPLPNQGGTGSAGSDGALG